MPKHSHDIYPQYFTVKLQQTSNDSTEILTINLPLPRIPTSGKATILEILWIEYCMPVWKFNNATASTQYYTIGVSTQNTAISPTTNPQDFITKGTTIDYWIAGINTATATAAFNPFYDPMNGKFKSDLQSNDGKGFLIANDSIYLSFATSNTGGASYITARFYYRFVDVSIQEYVGLVQSQQ